MPNLSPARAGVPILSELPLLHRGKVRDTYDLGDGYLLVVATDAISIFDFVLNALIPQKGAVLTLMSYFWFMLLREHDITTHFVAAGRQIDDFLPRHLRGNPDLQCRAMVVRRLEMAPVEFIARGYFLTSSSSLRAYPGNRMICGHELPEGLEDGDRLPRIIDTPTTKAEVGHDLPLDASEIRAKYPRHTQIFLEAFSLISDHALSRNIILADTKMELGRLPHGAVVLGDEVGTPDSSRFWDLHGWHLGTQVSPHKSPPPFDKQLVRQF
ncbi:MAG TPA: phosphoribosylaminoimidazolesuccinocarboxamide synthase, partial [Candidatus Paceibacterota bacterium]|nr:phosphoribosylaminoimidazolesuccinocarboxamide synthase [Candidatus Paceibacterota bacterium]